MQRVGLCECRNPLSTHLLCLKRGSLDGWWWVEIELSGLLLDGLALSGQWHGVRLPGAAVSRQCEHVSKWV